MAENYTNHSQIFVFVIVVGFEATQNSPQGSL